MAEIFQKKGGKRSKCRIQDWLLVGVSGGKASDDPPRGVGLGPRGAGSQKGGVSLEKVRGKNHEWGCFRGWAEEGERLKARRISL